MTTRRDLDAWAAAMKAGDDETAIEVLGAMCVTVGLLIEHTSSLCDQLRGVDARGFAARAAMNWDLVQGVVVDARMGFMRHERGGR